MRALRYTLIVFTVALLAALPVSAQNSGVDRPIKDKWAVIIGVSKFKNNQIPQLKYPAKDASDFRDFLIKKGNFSRDHILLLTDDLATKENIEDAFGDGWLPKRVLEDDLVVVFVSSHGSAKDGKGDNFIIAHDTDPNKPFSTGIRLQTLATDVTRRTGCDRLVLLLDACHSGAAVADAKGLTRGPGVDPESAVGVGQLVISSSKPEQVSWESRRYDNGVFTRKLIEALQVNGADTKVEAAYGSLKDGVEQEVRFDRTVSQTPQFLSKWQGTPLALCAPATAPRVVPSDAPPEPTASQPHPQIAVIPTSPRPPVKSTPASGNPPASLAPYTTPSAAAPHPAPEPGSGMAPAGGQRAGLLRQPMMTTHWQANGGDPTLESGTRLISEDELRGLSFRQVEIILNEAYARHGRGFLLPHLRTFYGQQPWYAPDPDYHWRADDPKVRARGGSTDDTLVVNAKRTPKQYANVETAKRVRSRLQGQ